MNPQNPLSRGASPSEASFESLREHPVAREEIFDGAIIRVERWTVRCGNGHLAQREVVLHRGAAAVVPLYPDGTTVLVRQHRVACDRVTLEIPAGKLDAAGEDPLVCARRELREETGLSAGRMTELTRILTTPGFCTEQIALYLAEDLTEGETHPDPDEILRLVRMPLAEAVSRVLAGEIRDAKTVCALLLAQETLRRRAEGEAP